MKGKGIPSPISVADTSCTHAVLHTKHGPSPGCKVVSNSVKARQAEVCCPGNWEHAKALMDQGSTHFLLALLNAPALNHMDLAPTVRGTVRRPIWPAP